MLNITGLLIGAALLLTPGTNPGDTSFSAATFTYSSDPVKVVLFFSSGGGLTGRITSMTLHGDGKLLLRKQRGKHILEEYSQTLDHQGIEELLRIAIDHGLAEWDGTSIRARQIQERGGNPFSTPEDYPTATVLLSIDNYKRGEYELPHVERHIRCDAPIFTAKYFPDIPEFQGIVKLLRRMSDLIRSARQERQQ